MTLVACKECGGSVSTKAKACPSCGAEIRSPKSLVKQLLRYAVYAVFGLILFVVFKAAYMTVEAVQRAGQ